MRARSSSKQSRNILEKIKVYFLILIFSVALFLFFFLGFSFLKIRNIEIKGNYDKKNLLGLEAFNNENIIFTSLDKIKKSLLQSNPQIKNVDVTKIYPQTLVLNIEVDQPIAYLKLNSGFAALDDKGKIIYKTRREKEKLPIINYYQQSDYYQITPGNNINYKEILLTLYLLDKARELDLTINGVDINSLNMIVFNLNERQILFTTEETKEKQVFEFETLIKQFKIEGKIFKKIDLRFNKPIIVFN